ncbi:Mitogen-activated protein kinase 7-like protein [Drosera capensis]
MDWLILPNCQEPAVRRRKHFFVMGNTVFQVDFKGAFGVVCSAHDRLANEDVAIKKKPNVFENGTVGLRILREMQLLRHMKHDYMIALKDMMLPDQMTNFQDAYLVYELMNTDLHHIIRSPQRLPNDHIQYFMFQFL